MTRTPSSALPLISFREILLTGPVPRTPNTRTTADVVPTSYLTDVPADSAQLRLGSGREFLLRAPRTGRAGLLRRRLVARRALGRPALGRNPRTRGYRRILGNLPVPASDHAPDEHADQRRDDQPGRHADGDPSERGDDCSSGRVWTQCPLSIEGTHI